MDANTNDFLNRPQFNTYDSHKTNGAWYVFDKVHFVQVRQDPSSHGAKNGYMRRIRDGAGNEKAAPTQQLHAPNLPAAPAAKVPVSQVIHVPLASLSSAALQAQSQSLVNKYPPPLSLHYKVCAPITLGEPLQCWLKSSTLNGSTKFQDSIFLNKDDIIFKEIAGAVAVESDNNFYVKNFDIHSIEMNLNMNALDMYRAKLKQVMHLQLDQSKRNEKFLWHGTTDAIARKIFKTGFDRTYSGTATSRACHGKGVYFAKNLDISLHEDYSRSESIQNATQKTLILSMVNVGDSCKGYDNMAHPDIKRDGITYDSMVNELQNPTIFVLGDGSDAQIFPMFIVRMRK